MERRGLGGGDKAGRTGAARASEMPVERTEVQGGRGSVDSLALWLWKVGSRLVWAGALGKRGQGLCSPCSGTISRTYHKWPKGVQEARQLRLLEQRGGVGAEMQIEPESVGAAPMCTLRSGQACAYARGKPGGRGEGVWERLARSLQPSGSLRFFLK